jgi:hypothetical protein
VWALSFCLSKLAVFLSLFGLAKAAKQDWSQHHVLILPVLIGGNAVRAGSSDEPRSRPRTDAIYLALDPDLGPDLSPGSAVLQIRVLCEPEEANIYNF